MKLLLKNIASIEVYWDDFKLENNFKMVFFYRRNLQHCEPTLFQWFYLKRGGKGQFLLSCLNSKKSLSAYSFLLPPITENKSHVRLTMKSKKTSLNSHCWKCQPCNNKVNRKKTILTLYFKKMRSLANPSHFLLFLSAKNHHWYPFMVCFIQENASENMSTWNTCIFLLLKKSTLF